jgi:7,8-dihydropterin-6-yl-methyl-4-(beta-D-ribofuranosyl)aminobenzene 5'-phosphate synthase
MSALRPVDRLEVEVLVDNVTDQLSTTPADVDSELVRLRQAGLETIAGESLCSAHHGLSLLVTADAGGRRHTVLFDTGPEGYAIERNAARLGIDLGAVEALVLSHGHWDHCGGAPAALALAGRRDLPVYAHPGMFRRRGRRGPDGGVEPFEPVPTPEAMAARGGRTVATAEPRWLDEGLFYVSGEIPRVTPYEHGMPNHVVQGPGGWEPDPLIQDERFLAVHVRDRGLVVFTACSHAGVVNVLTHARAVFPGLPLLAVIGGFHLSGPGVEAVIGDTVKDLATFGLERIVPAHCTGWRAVTALVNAFGEPAVAPSAVGKRFRF